MKATFSLACLALLLLPGCSSPKAEAPPADMPFTQDETLLVGTWTWESSTYHFVRGGPRVETPASTGHTETLTFFADGTVERYRDGTMDERTTYAVRPQVNPDGSETEPRLFIGDTTSGSEFGVHNRQLRISRAFVDGPVSFYVRAR